MGIYYSYTHAYESKLLPGCMFKTVDEARAFDQSDALQNIGLQEISLGDARVCDSILHLAEIIKDRRTDAWLAKYREEEAAKQAEIAAPSTSIAAE